MGDEFVQPIPERFKRKCHFDCGNPIDIRAAGVHQWTSGWVKNRVGGGGHGISLPEREDKWAHGYCIERVARGNLKQGRMF